MSKKNRPTDSGGNWMDTYGDMVTLLLTFFIMLYSMSNLDAQKWSIFVKSIPFSNHVLADFPILSIWENNKQTDIFIQFFFYIRYTDAITEIQIFSF